MGKLIISKGYAATNDTDPLVPFTFERKEPGVEEVLIDILYCGICHADIHQSKNEYGRTKYPFVPGHEIIGRVHSIGSQVRNFIIGDLVGVGYFINSCGHCVNCVNHEEHFCDNGMMPTHNGVLPDGSTTKGGYSNCIVVKEKYILKVSEKLLLPAVAPLLCAGITTYSAIKHNQIGIGHKVAILGLGGLGHMAVKFARSFGAIVTVLSSGVSKKESAFELGAHNFVHTDDEARSKMEIGSFDFVIDTVSARHDYNKYLNLLRKDGTLVLLGVPPEITPIHPGLLIFRRRKVVGSFIGGIEETQEMLDYCATHNITADVEVIQPDYINTAFERMLKGDVKYRFVIDMSGL
ncbi:NAD(P)-dependent alcohol dehydrogenase [Chitinophaga pinensis]|uniref:Alcohol dehydrogenase zinc-binding domain protein n=1 Tax=Chitinophaga pinensis (strain ATCC 43595 / DSM 2588 / LMG 13176 / NBRC 15968 / NCIMB 11800 / UQM 2034) TaxID=485918 RepID=A0A979GA27_CHIPD|nr:NAD(P)-dependent alcohol dehydrogenase [Chitinophaga pinensis]ACU63385.1 Alcohol dehydrogenase zinc-binding domain protein [Chitinophaga pinensis DSM 2588]